MSWNRARCCVSKVARTSCSHLPRSAHLFLRSPSSHACVSQDCPSRLSAPGLLANSSLRKWAFLALVCIGCRSAYCSISEWIFVFCANQLLVWKVVIFGFIPTSIVFPSAWKNYLDSGRSEVSECVMLPQFPNVQLCYKLANCLTFCRIYGYLITPSWWLSDIVHVCLPCNSENWLSPRGHWLVRKSIWKNRMDIHGHQIIWNKFFKRGSSKPVQWLNSDKIIMLVCKTRSLP